MQHNTKQKFHIFEMQNPTASKMSAAFVTGGNACHVDTDTCHLFCLKLNVGMCLPNQQKNGL